MQKNFKSILSQDIKSRLGNNLKYKTQLNQLGDGSPDMSPHTSADNWAMHHPHHSGVSFN